MSLDMASTDAAFGFEPYQNILHTSLYAVVTAVGTQICIGDPVGNVGLGIDTVERGAIPAVQVDVDGAAGAIVGVVLACFDENMFPIARILASEAGDDTVAGYVLVADDPQQQYICQEDGATSSMVVDDIGFNVDAVSTGTPVAANSYHSMVELASNGAATTATLAWHVLACHPNDTISSDNSAGNHARFIVKLNTAYMGTELTRI